MHEDCHIEQYEFSCQPCNYQWLMSYEVRAGARSDVLQFFYLTGMPATPPAAGRLCPNCWEPSYSCQRLDGLTVTSSRR